MSFFEISTIILGISTIIPTYYLIRRKNPKLEIIRLYKASTSQFTNYIDGLEFSYNGQVYPELSAIEFIIANKSYRSIELEDISSETPVEIYLDSPSIIHDFHIIKKVGESRVELVRVDDSTIRVAISSMDQGSSLRIKILCNGKETELKTRGKLYKANRSVSKTKNLGGTNIAELIQKLLRGGKILFFVSLFLSFAASSLATFIEFDTTPEKAIILPPDEFFTLNKEFIVIDSLLEDSNTAKITLIHEAKNGETDSINVNLVTSDWLMHWWGENDKHANEIADSLKSIGYIVEFSTIIDLGYHLRNGYEKEEDIKYPQFSVLIKAHNTSYYVSLIKLFILIFFLGTVAIYIEIALLNFKSIYWAFKYKSFLSESEVNEIKEEYKNVFFSRLLVKLL